jgi:hypothetical protein
MIVVFAGAGASKAVDPSMYPTTAEFFERLPDSIRGTPLFGGTVEFLRQKDPDATIDIELVLWAIEELRDAVSALVDPQTLPGWLVRPAQFTKVTHGGYNTRQFLERATELATATERLWSEINAQVYRLYHLPPPAEGLGDTWIPLLQTLSTTGKRVEVFTTNYDVVLEDALSRVDLPVHDGRTKGTQPVLDTSLWQRGGDQRVGLLTKLHGSVDWSRSERAIHTGTPLYQGDHDRHVIIYPGFKGTPEREPFQTFHEHFRSCMTRAELVIFIGFAFRDTTINQLLRSTHRVGTKIVVVNPAAELPGLPYGASDVIHIQEPFSAALVDQIRRHFPS